MAISAEYKNTNHLAPAPPTAPKEDYLQNELSTLLNTLYDIKSHILAVHVYLYTDHDQSAKPENVSNAGLNVQVRELSEVSQMIRGLSSEVRTRILG